MLFLKNIFWGKRIGIENYKKNKDRWVFMVYKQTYAAPVIFIEYSFNRKVLKKENPKLLGEKKRKYLIDFRLNDS